MKLRKVQFVILMMLVFVQYISFAQTNKESETIYFQEDFNGWTNIEAEGWYTYSPVGWNYISPQDDAINFFKQDPADYMMLISPEIDFTNINLLEFIYKAGSSVDNKKLEVGVMTDPTDPSTFEIINIITVEGFEWMSDEASTPLDAVTGMKHLVFNISASSPIYTIIDIDSVVLSDEGAASDWPNYISNLEIVPEDLGVNSAMLSWTNPDTEADGDPLTELAL